MTVGRIRSTPAEMAVRSPSSSLAVKIVRRHPEWAAKVGRNSWQQVDLAVRNLLRQAARVGRSHFDQSHQVQLAGRRQKPLAVKVDRRQAVRAARIRIRAEMADRNLPLAWQRGLLTEPAAMAVRMQALFETVGRSPRLSAMAVQKQGLAVIAVRKLKQAVLADRRQACQSLKAVKADRSHPRQAEMVDRTHSVQKLGFQSRWLPQAARRDLQIVQVALAGQRVSAQSPSMLKAVRGLACQILL